MDVLIDSDWRDLNARERDYLRLAAELDTPTPTELEEARSGRGMQGSEYRTIQMLEDKGLLAREQVSGRASIVRVTDAGRGLLRRAGVTDDE